MFKERGWFLGGPLLNFAVASIVLLLGFAIMRPRGRAWLLLIGIGAETVGIAVVVSR